MPSADSAELPTYGSESIEVLLNHYGVDKPALTLSGEEAEKSALISYEVQTEWITFQNLLAKKPKESMASQLKELITNEMLITMFPNLHKLASIASTIPVSTDSVKISFSQMKFIKTRLRNRISECRLSDLMKIAIESPQTLTDEDVEEILTVWNRKPRRISI